MASASLAEPLFGLALSKEPEPSMLLCEVALGVDEAVDGLVGYEGEASFQCQATSDLGEGPASTQTGEDLLSQGRDSV